VAYLQPDKGQISTSNHLGIHEVMDAAHVLKFIHELGNIIGLSVPRKHGIIHHGQGTGAEVKKFPNLGSSILKLHSTASAVFICPKIDVIRLGKSKKGFNSRIYSLFFGGSIQKRTYEQHREKEM
jgi:hypothetical protein